MAQESSRSDLPTGQIGTLRISRLIIGGNQFSGWSHSRDLKYLRGLFQAYATEYKIMETLEMCEESGVNAIITSASGYLNKYWKERGGRIQWIAQVHPKTTDLTSNIKRAIDNGAVGAYVQGGIGDSFVKNGRVDLLGKAVEFIKDNGLIAGIGGHSVEVPMAVEKGPLWQRIIFTAIYNLSFSRIPAMDKEFWTDDRCNACGICLHVCSASNITLREGKPLWNHRCEQCFACLQWCPVEAIQCTRITKGRKRYHHPDVTLDDIRMQRPSHSQKQ